MSSSTLTPDQLNDVVVIERVCSTLSCIGCLFIIISFLTFKPFRQRAINRLVLYASIGNTFTNIATFISRSALSNPTSPLCQFQGFLIQMYVILFSDNTNLANSLRFMSADAYWTCAMPCNVWLTFYHRFTAEDLRRIERWYFLVCYGIPFIPAFAFIWISDSAGKRIYGDAVLWCWVTAEYNYLRMALFYGPVWYAHLFPYCSCNAHWCRVSVVLTLAIYIVAGKKIYKDQKLLRSTRSQEEKSSQIQSRQEQPASEYEQEQVFGMKCSNDVRVTSMAIPMEEVHHADCVKNGQECQSQYHQPLYTVS